MYLDAAEEKMLRAIVQSAVASAAAGRPFAGEFRHYRIGAKRLRVNERGVVQVEGIIVHRIGTGVQTCCEFSIAAGAGEVDHYGEIAVVAFGACRRDGVHMGDHCGIVPSFPHHAGNVTSYSGSRSGRRPSGG